jgi:D-tyrosyl-tRNA(Tyr) deacylase
MIGLLQRVTRSSVEVDGQVVAAIGCGLLVLIGIEREDTVVNATRLVERLLSYRVFPDAAGRMNASLRDLGEARAGLLLVPQFTLAANTSSGTRASFTAAAEPARARAMYQFLLEEAGRHWPRTVSGVFGADMQVSLVNDGPVTFRLTA